jgi:isopentenyl diphosphate isomerase/L-lactate dehydrogenase-like FMN-dependent dehydrogenase
VPPPITPLPVRTRHQAGLGARHAGHQAPHLRQYPRPRHRGRRPRSLSKWTATQFDLTLNWKDIGWIKDRFGGPVVVKGVLDPEDAQLALDNGADAIIVSNHGGRQLDGAPSTIRVLPEIVEAVGHKTEVLMDSGIRSGQDVLKASRSAPRAPSSAAP